MEEKMLKKFKELLLSKREQILSSGFTNRGEDLEVPSEELADEADLANSVINQQVSFKIREREMLKLRQIDMALVRIEEGSYGHCEDCGDTIGEKRLFNQPWTELCIEHAEEREKSSRIA